jgi:tetratricopeptide (TPR) repeat protein
MYLRAMYRAGWRAVLILLQGLFALGSPAQTRSPSPPEPGNPAQALEQRFEAAKGALAVGDLRGAEGQYRLAMALGLRQLGNLAISEQQFEQATAYLDQALELLPDDTDLRVDDAVAWFRRGEAQKAAELLESVLSVDSGNARAHNALGRIFLFEGDTGRAVSELQKARAIDPDFETQYFLGVALLRSKKSSEAADLFVELRESMGESAALHVLFGRAYTITHFPEQAVQEFRKAIKVDPKYPRAHALLGYATLEFYGETSYPQAKELFQQELQLQPDDYLSLVLLGICDTSLREYRAAETVLLRATRLRADGPSPYLYLGETYTATGRFELAVGALRKYVSLARTPQESNRNLSRGYFLLGQNLLRVGGRADQARQALAESQKLREAQFKYDQTHMFLTPEEQSSGTGLQSAADARSLSSDRMAGVFQAGEEQAANGSLAQNGLDADNPGGPKMPKAAEESASAKRYRAFASEVLASSYNDLGVMRAQNQNFAEATAFFKRAHEWNPALPGLDRNLGLAAYRAESYGDAVPPLKRELAAHPNDQSVRKILALSLFAQDDFSGVAGILRPLLPNPPDDPALLFAWGSSLVKLRESANAERIFQQLIRQNSLNPGVHYLLGQAYAQSKNYPDALNELATAVKLDPTLIEAHYYTGLVYLHQSDFENAAREFRSELLLRPGEPVTSYHLAFALLSAGQRGEAIGLLREVIRAKPDYEPAYFELGRALLQEGDAPGAIASLEKAKNLQPDRDITYFQLSQAYRRAGRPRDAEQALTTYKKMIEESRQKRRQSLETESP